jgi:L-ascorbate metabolism protein UlaG (beta-lactamase superfamily)
MGDTIKIAKRNNATVLCSYEIAFLLGWKGVKAVGMEIGGTHTLPFSKITMTRAVHGSGVCR